jgi:hypothetical protein
MYFAKDWSLRRRILTGYYFWILKAATRNHPQYWITLWIITLWIMITELPQQIYSGIPILFNLLSLVVILRSNFCLSTRAIKLVLQGDVLTIRIGGQQLPLIAVLPPNRTNSESARISSNQLEPISDFSFT